MKKSKVLVITLIFLIIFQSLFAFTCAAAGISAETQFEYKITKLESGSAPGNIKVDLYCQTDPEEFVTTLGASLVINTDYVDVVNKKGEAVTGSYKQEVVQLGKSAALSAAKIGQDEESFSSFKGLSLASYNAGTKNMYIFLCGMALSGIRLSEKSQIATLYLNAKTDGKLPAGAIRLMKESEYGTACSAKAVFVNEISTKKEVGNAVSPMTIEVDSALMDKEQPTTAPTTTQKQEQTTTAAPETIPAVQEEPSAETEPAVELTTKPIEEMNETEIEQEIEDKITVIESITPSPEQKQTEVYQSYETAVKKAQKVLEDKKATKQEKAEALKEVREAEQQLKEEIPELAEQIEAVEQQLQASSERTPWLFIGIGGAVAVIAAIVIVLIIKNKKKANIVK